MRIDGENQQLSQVRWWWCRTAFNEGSLRCRRVCGLPEAWPSFQSKLISKGSFSMYFGPCQKQKIGGLSVYRKGQYICSNKWMKVFWRHLK